MAAGIQVRATSLPTKAPAPEMIMIERMEMELAEADFIGFFISPNFVQTGWTMQELQLVLHRRVSGEGGAVVIPILWQMQMSRPCCGSFHGWTCEMEIL